MKKYICSVCDGIRDCEFIYNYDIDNPIAPDLCPFGVKHGMWEPEIDANWQELPESDYFEMRGIPKNCSNNCDNCKDSSIFEQKRKAATPEPAPTGNGNFVLFEVMKDICARADAGQKKYGTMLRTENGRDALNDALQEAIDLVFYLKQKIMEDGK